MSTYLIVVGCGLAAASMIGIADSDFTAALLVADANLSLVGLFTAYVLKARRKPAALVLALLPGIVLSWPLSSIYFACFNSEATYRTLYGEVVFVEGMLGVQIAVMVFLCGYLGTGLIAYKLGHPYRLDSSDSEPTPAMKMMIWIGLFATVGGWIGPLLRLPVPLLFVLNAARNYLSPLILIAGFLWGALRQGERTVIIASLAGSFGVLTIANARGLALMPILLLIIGYVIAARHTRRAKGVLVTVFILSMPIYAVVGNQTRLAMQTIGFAHFGDRATVMTDALSTGDVLHQHGGFLDDSLGRLFGTGGHSLIIRNWGSRSLDDFDLPVFLGEAFRSLLPAFLTANRAHEYTSNEILTDYGFLISESSSVEVSLIGSLFNYGGLFTVLIGGIISALMLMALTRSAARFRDKGLASVWLAGSISITIWAYNNDIIQILHHLFWTLFYLTIGYQIVQYIVVPLGRRSV